MVAARVRNAEEVKRGEWLIARCELLIMDSLQYNTVNYPSVLKMVAKEYRVKLGVLDRDTDSYRDEVGTDATLHEIRRKIKDVSDICKAFDDRAEKLSTVTRRWCNRHNTYDCTLHPDVEPVPTLFNAAPLAGDRSPMDVKLGEHVDMSSRFPDFGCGDCPHAKDCFQRSVCFEAVKEMVPEDTDSEELKRLIETAFMVTSSATNDVVHGSEDDMTPEFDHCTICWERIPYGHSYCNECYDAAGEVQAETRNADGEVVPYPDVDSWADAF